MEEEIHKAIEVFNNGGIVIFPTDTAFGIGCRIDNEKAVERLFEVRRRPKEKAVPVLVGSITMAKDYVQPFNDKAQQLMDKYWPGALTIVLDCKTDRVPSLVRGGGNTIGVRMPDHDRLLNIIAAVGVPILGPSANFAGEKTPFSLGEIDKNLVQLVDYILSGSTKNNQASTVVDCTKEPWEILRQGAIKINK